MWTPYLVVSHFDCIKDILKRTIIDMVDALFDFEMEDHKIGGKGA